MKLKNKFYDKNKNLIKLGDKLIVTKEDKEIFEDCIVKEENGILGIMYNKLNFFVPLYTLHDEFFEECEINNK